MMSGCPSSLPAGPYYRILVACCVILILCDITTATWRSSIWRRNLGQSTVTSSLMSSRPNTPRRSVLGCVMRCQETEGCDSVAFDHASGACYLQPTYNPYQPGDPGPPVQVYSVQTVSNCKPSEAPDIDNAHVTQWHLTSTSLVGDVSCDEDCILSENVTSHVRCQAENGAWTTLMAATCNKFAWRNYTVKIKPATYPLPHPAKVGLCVRVKGMPTAVISFSVNLMSGLDDIILQVNPRLNSNNVINVTCLSERLNQVWGRTKWLRDPFPPFPFAAGLPFEMVITAVSMHQFSIQVNGVQYADYMASMPVTDVTKIMFDGKVAIEHLIIGC